MIFLGKSCKEQSLFMQRYLVNYCVYIVFKCKNILGKDENKDWYDDGVRVNNSFIWQGYQNIVL